MASGPALGLARGAVLVAGDRDLRAVLAHGVGGEAAAEAVPLDGHAEVAAPARLVAHEGAPQDRERRQGPTFTWLELELSHGRAFDPRGAS